MLIPSLNDSDFKRWFYDYICSYFVSQEIPPYQICTPKQALYRFVKAELPVRSYLLTLDYIERNFGEEAVQANIELEQVIKTFLAKYSAFSNEGSLDQSSIEILPTGCVLLSLSQEQFDQLC